MTQTIPDPFAECCDGLEAVRVVYVSKSGDDANDGDLFDAPKLTIVSAINRAGALTPTESAPVVIHVLDGGTYEERVTLAQDVWLWAPAATITYSEEAGNTLNLANRSVVRVHRVFCGSSGVSAAVALNGGSATFHASVVESSGPSTWNAAIRSDTPGRLILTADRLIASGGSGIYLIEGTVNARVGMVEITDAGWSVWQEGGALELSAGALISAGRGVTLSENAVADVMVGHLSGVTHAYRAGDTSVLNLFAGRITGSDGSGLGTVNVTVAGAAGSGVDPSDVAPEDLGTAAAGVSADYSRGDHVHAMPSAADVGAVATTAVGAASGVAPLDGDSLVPLANLPTITADLLDQVSMVYVSKAGNDASSGLHVGEPKLTIGAALTVASTLSPSATNKVAIQIMGGGDFDEAVSLPSHTYLIGPSATLKSSSATTLTLADGSMAMLDRIQCSAGTASSAVRLSTASASAMVVANEIASSGASTSASTVRASATGSASLCVRAGVISAEQGSAVWSTSANVRVDANRIQVTGASGFGVYVDGGRLMASVRQIDSVGRGVSIASTGEADLVVNRLAGTVNTYAVGASATLNMFVGSLSGTPGTVAGTSNVTEAGVTGGGGPDPSDADPQPLGVAASGVSADYSRADHVHALPAIPEAADTAPEDLGTAAVGISAKFAREDHVHNLPAIPDPSDASPQAAGVAAPGVSADFSRADHVHPEQTVPDPSDANPQALGVAASGVSADYSRADHVHVMPSAADVGADPAGTGASEASSAVTGHENAADPHPQYAQKTRSAFQVVEASVASDSFGNGVTYIPLTNTDWIEVGTPALASFRVKLLYAMAGSNAGTVELRLDTLALSAGDNPGASMASGTPFTITPGAGTNLVELDSANMDITASPGDLVRFRLTRTGGTHPDAMRVFTIWPE